MDKKGFDYSKAVQDLIDTRPVWKQITGTILKEIIPDKNNWFAAVFSLILSGVLAYIVGTSAGQGTVLCLGEKSFNFSMKNHK